MKFFAGIFLTDHYWDRPVTVHPRVALRQRPDVVVSIGAAPDGLPLVLSVARSASVRAAVLRRLRDPDITTLAPDLVAALDALDAAVSRRARADGITASGTAYRTAGSIQALMGETLLARILGVTSPLLRAEDRAALTRPSERVAMTAAVALAPDPEAARSVADRRLHLEIPLDSGPPLIVSAAGPGERPRGQRSRGQRSQGQRPLGFETLLDTLGAMIHHQTDSDHWYAEPLKSGERTARVVREARSLAWTVDRTAVAGAIAALGEAVGQLHLRGRVHGDLKPQNALLLAGGPRPIDALEIPSGEISPGATPGWAAPEQLLAQPITAAADVFPLALMLVTLLGAVVYGQEVRPGVVEPERFGRFPGRCAWRLVSVQIA